MPLFREQTPRTLESQWQETGTPAGLLRPPACPSQAWVQATLKIHWSENCQSCCHSSQKPRVAVAGPAGACLRAAERPAHCLTLRLGEAQGSTALASPRPETRWVAPIWRFKGGHLGYFTVTRFGGGSRAHLFEHRACSSAEITCHMYSLGRRPRASFSLR